MRYGLLGEKLGHSHSPRLHALLGCEDYVLAPTPREALHAFLTERNFAGVNVTIPYKRDVMPYCAELSDAARAIGSVNTLLKRADGTLFGDNTDAYGLRKMAEKAGVRFGGKKTLVLGGGGTGRTACHVVEQEGGRAVTISRGGENDYADLARHADAQIVINATPVGMYPAVDASPLDLRLLPNLTHVLDAVYNPLRTRLLQQAEALGLAHAGGLTMLVWQGVRARELFDGLPVPPEAARGAEAALRREVSNLVLIGMPGSGKTRIGQLCAMALGMAHADADTEVERRADKPIPQIFAEDGEERFRALEGEVLAGLGSRTGLVISTGGGAVLREGNRFHLRMNGVVARIRRPLPLLSTGGRPLSKSPQALAAMEAEREPLYRSCADYTVDNDGALQSCADKVVEKYLEILGD